MKCTHCNIEVGSNAKICPLCQSALVGEAEKEYWPSPKELKHHSMVWKVYLFISFVAAAVCFLVDFMIVETKHFHWSLFVIGWIVIAIYLISLFIKNHRTIPKNIFQTMLIISIMMFVTGYFGGFRGVSVDIIMPIICSITLVTNFVFSFIDAGFTDSALFYMLLNIGVGTIPYLVLWLTRNHHAPVAWTVSLMISVITFIGLAVFKGKTMLSEIEKRLHF